MAKNENPKPVSNKAHLTVSLTSLSSTISLSVDPTAPSLQLTATARIVSSTSPNSAITFCTDKSILDNGQHERQDGLFWGALDPLQSTTDAKRTIQVAFAGSPNYGSQPDASPNLREQPWTHFETVPPTGQGVLTIQHDISLDRLFRNSRNLKLADIQAGEKFRVGMNAKRAFRGGWWAFGDMNGDLKEKKFTKWESPDEDGEISNLMPGEERPDVEQMVKEGWVFSQRFDYLEITQDDAGDDVVIEFVE